MSPLSPSAAPEHGPGPEAPGLLDVLVISFGAAGLAAAVTATRLGASVLVLEKQPEYAHTPNTRMSGGMIMSVTDAGRAAGYLDACGGGMVPPALSQAWAERTARLPAWLAEFVPGLPFTPVAGAENPEIDGAEAISVLQPGTAVGRLGPAARGGPALWDALLAAARREGVQVRWDSPVRRLTRDADRAVTRVELADGTPLAARSVILARGGYEFDEAMKQDYLRAYPVHFYGNPGNTADGVRMAMDAGADLWHMNQMIGRAIGHFRQPDGSPLGFIISIGPPGYVITDRDGQRFADETAQAALLHGFYHELLRFDHQRGEYPRIPCYWFFDERRRLAGPLTHPHIGACGVGLYEWSADNSREIAAGWIHQGATVEEVAAAAGVRDPAAAATAVRDYNAACGPARAPGRLPDPARAGPVLLRRAVARRVQHQRRPAPRRAGTGAGRVRLPHCGTVRGGRGRPALPVGREQPVRGAVHRADRGRGGGQLTEPASTVRPRMRTPSTSEVAS